jgi:hypothetical protein
MSTSRSPLSYDVFVAPSKQAKAPPPLCGEAPGAASASSLPFRGSGRCLYPLV